MADQDTLSRLAQEVGLALSPLEAALNSPASFNAFLNELGWDMTTIPPPISALGGLVNGLIDLLNAGEVDISSVQAVISSISGVINAIQALSNETAAYPPTVDPALFAAEFPEQLIDFLLVDYLLTQRPSWGRLLQTLGVIRLEQVPAAGKRPTYTKRVIGWSDLGRVLSDPPAVFRDSWGWGSASFQQENWLNSVLELFDSIGLTGRIEPLDANVQNALSPGAPGTDPIHDWVLRVPLVGDPRAPMPVEMGFGLYMLPANGLQLPGFAALPYATGNSATTIDVSDTLQLTIEATFDLQGGAGLLVRPGAAADLIFDFIPSGGGGSPQHGTSLSIGLASTASQPLVLLGSSGGSRLAISGASIKTGARLAADNKLDIFGELAVQGGQLVIQPGAGEADSFIATLLPGGGINADFSFGIGLSSHDGLYVTGSGGLEIQVPVHVSIGPVDVTAVTLTLSPASGSLPIDIGATMTGQLGPLSATVENFGFEVLATFPGSGGNLGPIALALGFKPPTGVGLSIDAGVVAGGGFLSIDTAHGLYAGALQLTLADFLSVTAIGLIETKLPDGSSGFSLLIIVTADFGAGIQLGFGFTLDAVGGLLGLNRGMLFQPIMDAIRTNAITSVLFPQNVIANASRIISDLQAFFPPQPGTFLIGPMAKIGWGEPTLASVSLGVIIEIPPGDIAILGIIRMALPADDVAILVLQVNFAGAIEVDKQRIYFYATLFDSHILFVTIDGSMGLLVAWGDNANFVVSVGGFDPQYSPPPLPFPPLQRVSLDLINESFARIHADGYFAVTSNTVQFGTHADYFFGFSALNVQGASSFDALIQFSPFHFSVSFSTSFSVNVFGVGCFGIDISLSVDGPTPFHASGTASISFFFFSVGINIDFTWGDSRNTTLPPVAVMPILTGELSKRSNWRAVPPAGSNLLVSLRQLDPSETALVLHPVGALQISQRRVPLELVLDIFGSQQPTDANSFALDVTSPGLTKTRTLQEQFAPAQFKNFSDADKLSQPGYVPMDSGIEVAVGGISLATGTAITRNVRYDLTIIDTKLRRVFTRFYLFTASLFRLFLAGGAVGRSPLSALRQAQTHPYSGAVTVAPETFAVALVANNTLFHPEAGAFTSQVAANDYVARSVAADPTLSGTLHVLPQFELAA